MNTREKYAAAVEEYLRRLRFNNLSDCTINNYKRVLSDFSAFLAEQPEDCDLYDAVEQWRDAMLNSGSMPSTVKQKLTTLKIFFDKATKRSFPAELRFSENPVDEDFMPKVTKKPYCDLLDDSDIIKLWRNVPPTQQTAHTWARNYAIVCLILGTGLRNKEVLDLRLSDVDFYHAEITVKSGKGDKFRIVDAPEIVLQSLEQYLKSGLRPADVSDDDYLFGTTGAHQYGKVENSVGAEKWHRGSKEWLSALIEHHVDNVCGGENHIRSHDLRHLFARLQLNASGNISELQAALGHSSPDITQIYAGRVQPHRKRDSAREVLSARDRAAAELKKQNQHEQKVILLNA